MKRCAVAAAATAGLCLSAVDAAASGFELREQGASGLGQAFAGASAGGEDLSATFYNPATVAVHGTGSVASLTYLHIRSDVTDVQGTTAAGTPAGGTGGSDAVPDAFVPALYGARAINENLLLGLAVNAPWGLATDYDEGWEGRYHALETDIMTINVNPVVAWRSERIQLGAGLQVQYAEGTMSNAIDFGSLGQVAPGQMDGAVALDGDDWSLGFTLGAIVTPWDGARLGVAYRSKVSHDISGRARFRDDDANIAATLRATTGAFADTDFNARLTTPERLSVGLRQDLPRGWTLSGEVQWTRWSRFDEFRVRFDNPDQPDDVTRHDWSDSWFFALGTQWRPNEAWTLRAGVAHDISPVDTATRTPRIPDSDRTWISLGAGYSPTDWLSFDAGWSRVFLATARVDQRADAPGNEARGGLRATFDNKLDTFAIQGLIRF